MKRLKKKGFLGLTFLLVLLIPISDVVAASMSSQVSGKYLNHATDWSIYVIYLKTTINPGTGHIQGEVKFTIQVAKSSHMYTRVRAFHIYGDGHDCNPVSAEERYSNTRYYVAWGGAPETYIQYINIVVDSTWDDGYSTTLRLEVYSGAFSDSSPRYIFEQVLFMKVGSVYYGFSSGFCVTDYLPYNLELT